LTPDNTKAKEKGNEIENEIRFISFGDYNAKYRLEPRRVNVIKELGKYGNVSWVAECDLIEKLN